MTFEINDIPVVTTDLTPICDNWGPRIDMTRVLHWTTKKAAVAAARAIGWPVNSVVKVHTRFSMDWALTHPTKNGHISTDTYRALYERWNGERPYLGSIVDGAREDTP